MKQNYPDPEKQREMAEETQKEMKEQQEMTEQDEEICAVVRLLTAECYKTSVDHGWYQGVDFNLPEKLCLIHSEISEALEEYRNPDVKPTEIYFHPNSNKPEGLPVELADAMIRIFDLCGHLKIDLAEALLLKMNFNRNRPYRHGGKKA